MGIFNKIDEKLERLVNCPSCRHTSEYGVIGCGCTIRAGK